MFKKRAFTIDVAEKETGAIKNSNQSVKEEIMIERSPFSKLDHIGVLVRDIDRAVEYCSALGIGTCGPLPATVVNRKIYGKPANDVRNKVIIARIGQIRLELIQPGAGDSIKKEFLDRKGEGIHHLAFLVEDINKEVTELVDKGFEVISSGEFLNGGGFVILDARRVGDILIELVKWPAA